MKAPAGSTGSAATLAGLGIQDPTTGMWDRMVKPLCLCGGMRRAPEPVRATQGPKELCLPVGQSLEVQKGQGLEIRTLPGTALPQQSHRVPRGHPKPVTAAGGGSGAHCRASPVLVWLLPELCTLLPPQQLLRAQEGGSKVTSMSLILSPSQVPCRGPVLPILLHSGRQHPSMKPAPV